MRRTAWALQLALLWGCARPPATAPQPPAQTLAPLVREFVRYILSREGQKAVADFGAVPLPADLAALNSNRLR